MNLILFSEVIMKVIKNVLTWMVCFFIVCSNSHTVKAMEILNESEIITATHQAPLYYEPNQPLTIETRIELSYTLTAMGMTVTFPNGWTFIEHSGANPSDISPKETDSTVSFAWMNRITPQVLTFNYSVSPTEMTEDYQNIVATIFFRAGPSEEMSLTVAPTPLIVRADIDSDGDGIKNSQDAFPDDKNEWEDTDHDGQGNNTDLDDDDDGMPDEWEIENHLDPLANDANSDLDEDGYTNLQEFQNGTLPFNFHPHWPDLISPANDTTDIPLSPALVIGEFVDNNEGDSHSGTDWEISTNISNFQNPIYSAHTDSDQLSLQLPDFVLEPDIVYYWRVRHYDQHGEYSAWSTGHFKTIVQTDFINGIPNDQTVDDNIDIDQDGTSDNQQPSIKSLTSVVGNIHVGIKSESPGNYTVNTAKTIDPSQDIANNVNRPALLPFGMIAFKVNVDVPGSSAKISVHYSDPLPENARWYTYDHLNGWDSYIPQLSNDRKIVTLYLTDGGDGDADGVKNGIIIDPAGPGISEIPDSQDTIQLNNDIDNGSCFIGTLQMN